MTTSTRRRATAAIAAAADGVNGDPDRRRSR
jgi:hypothetical protein